MDTLSTTKPSLDQARRLVVKVGSALLVNSDTGSLNRQWLHGLGRELADLRAGGRQVLVVSSGSIALGRQVLGLGQGALTLEQAQAAAAVGQPQLIAAWDSALSPHGLRLAQILLTLEDTQNRRRYLNGRATLKTLLGLGTMPVVNENDTVATDEIRYGDNDRLAARVALMAGADTLVLLSDVDGLYTANPHHDPQARHLAEIREITPEIEAMASGPGSALARGGMATKLMAAKTAMQGGCAMVVTRGDIAHPLGALMAGARASWFLPRTSPAAARKQWIAAMKPAGRLVADPGAIAALHRGKSLLPAGVCAVEGEFERGDPVAIVDTQGSAVGAALACYNSADARAIAGMKSGQIADILGYVGRSALAHRDDMVIWGT